MPSAPVATALQAKLESRHGINAYVDTTRTDGTKVSFPERLMTAIADAPVFVCLLGERDGQHTLESEWVLKEIQQAYDLRKFCIPVFQESYRPLPDMPPAVDYLLGFDGVHILDQKNIMIDESVRQLAELIQPQVKRRRIPWLILSGLLLIVVLAAVIFAVLNQSTPPGTVAPTLSGFQQVQTTQAEQIFAAETQAAADLTATEDGIRSANAAAQFAATETAAYATLLALSATPTPRPTDTNTPTVTPTPTITPTPTATTTTTPTPDPLQVVFIPVARNFTGSNADWTPYERDFDGVTMVLVPAGCFMMGSTGGQEDEQPVHEQCFDAPFWIDRTEVTQADFERLGGVNANGSCFDGDNRPVECITWFEARDFCALRRTRLPTEREWEYAARGPDNLTYPWGNTWNENNAVWDGNSNGQTANVGSRPAGASWVGALDMSGNVWEWASSLYQSYPYDAADGREADTGDRADVWRVVRGGSWLYAITNFLRAADRGGGNPDYRGNVFGFRCARSFG